MTEPGARQTLEEIASEFSKQWCGYNDPNRDELTQKLLGLLKSAYSEGEALGASICEQTHHDKHLFNDLCIPCFKRGEAKGMRRAAEIAQRTRLGSLDHEDNKQKKICLNILAAAEELENGKVE